jgi:hypothetical protein
MGEYDSVLLAVEESITLVSPELFPALTSGLFFV